MPLLFAVILISCADLMKSDGKGKIQNEINQSLAKNARALSTCAHTHALFDQLQSEEIRIDVHLVINENGRMDKFTTENDMSYPSEFIDCIFNTLDKIDYPKSATGEVIELDQPLIFKK